MATEWLGCGACVHYQNNGTCQAFPGKIPIPIISGELPHTKKVIGQVGDIVFESKQYSA